MITLPRVGVPPRFAWIRVLRARQRVARHQNVRYSTAQIAWAENNIPYSADFLFAFRARTPAHSVLCNGLRNAEGGRKGKLNGMFFDRNRLRLLFGFINTGTTCFRGAEKSNRTWLDTTHGHASLFSHWQVFWAVNKRHQSSLLNS